MKEDVSSTVEYFDGDVMAATVWEKKYALRDENGEAIEHTPTDMHHRMAKYFADVEAKYDIAENGAIDKTKLSEYGQERKPLTEEEIFKLFDRFKYVVPGGSVMSGLGSTLPVSLSNCWVIDSLNDSIEGIFNTCNEMSQLFKRRGGVGFDISKLRPSGAKVNNSAKYSTGAVSFMDLFSTVTTTIAQCIEENQQLLTRSGLVKIKDINIGDEVWTRKGFIKVINKYDKGIQPLVTLKTKNLSELLATSDHVLMSASEGIGPVNKKISELAIGDPIAMLHGNNTITEYQGLDYNYEKPIVKVTKDGIPLPHNRYEEIEIPRVLGEQLAYIIGYCHGDGYTYRGRDLSVAINNADTDIKDKLFEYRKNVFGHETHSTDKRGTYSVIHICGTEGCKLLEENGLGKPKTEFLRIPSKVWLSPHSVQMAYLSGLFDADGYASGSKKGYSFCTINLDFAKDIRKMLLMNGIFSVIHCEDPHKENWHVKYHVNVIGTYNQKGFVDKLNESVKTQRKRFVSKTDHIKSPFIVGNEGIKKTPWIPYKHLITNESLDRIGNYNDSMLSLDYVESISDCGEGHVYDIELESENMFWCEGFYVHNCGRRGAAMLSIHIDHPDAKEFIEKKQDLTKVTGANISVQIGDDFMNAVINDTDFYQTWPIDKKVNIDESAEYDTLVETTDEDGNKAYFKKIRAKELWNTLVHCAWNTAEPGILFKTKHYNYSPDGIYDRFRGTSTNPCLVGDTMIQTDKGPISIKDIVERMKSGESFRVLTFNEVSKENEYKDVESGQMTKSDANVIEIETEDGQKLRLTPDHRVYTENRGWVEASKLVETDVLLAI